MHEDDIKRITDDMEEAECKGKYTGVNKILDYVIYFLLLIVVVVFSWLYGDERY